MLSPRVAHLERWADCNKSEDCAMKQRTSVTHVIALMWMLSPVSAAQLGSADLKNLDGTWGGELRTYRRDGPNGATLELKSEVEELRLVIRRTPTDMRHRKAQGQWVSVSPSFLSRFTYQMALGTLVGSFLASGDDRDGRWVEYQSLYVTRKDSSTLLLYWFRGVNNVDMASANLDSKWLNFRLAELHKAP
jgi:hypothetical protein